MSNLIEELKVKLISILNLTDVKPDDFDENAQLVGGELGIDSIDVLKWSLWLKKIMELPSIIRKSEKRSFTRLPTLLNTSMKIQPKYPLEI